MIIGAADAAHENCAARAEPATGRRTFIMPKESGRGVDGSVAAADAANDPRPALDSPLNVRHRRTFRCMGVCDLPANESVAADVQVNTAGQAQGSASKVLNLVRRDKHAAEQVKR